MKTTDLIILGGVIIAVSIIVVNGAIKIEKIKAMCTQPMSVVMCIE